MLTIRKVFTILCLLCLCGISKLFFQMSVRVYSVPGQTEGTRKAFWSEQTQIYPLNCLLHMGVMLTNINVFIFLFLHCLWEQGTPRQSKNKSARSPLNWVSRYVLFLVKVKRRKSFWGLGGGGCRKGCYSGV